MHGFAKGKNPSTSSAWSKRHCSDSRAWEGDPGKTRSGEHRELCGRRIPMRSRPGRNSAPAHALPTRERRREGRGLRGSGRGGPAAPGPPRRRLAREARGPTLTSHTPVFCLAPVRSSSPRSAMRLSPGAVRARAAAELEGARGERPQPTAGADCRCRSPTRRPGTREREHAAGSRDCACALWRRTACA